MGKKRRRIKKVEITVHNSTVHNSCLKRKRQVVDAASGGNGLAVNLARRCGSSPDSESVIGHSVVDDLRGRQRVTGTGTGQKGTSESQINITRGGQPVFSVYRIHYLEAGVGGVDAIKGGGAMSNKWPLSAQQYPATGGRHGRVVIGDMKNISAWRVQKSGSQALFLRGMHRRQGPDCD